MNDLKKTIENTLINNLEVETRGSAPYYAGLELESIERCSDYIAQEIRDVAIAFANLVKDNFDESRGLNTRRLFEEFIADRYKEEDK